MMQDDLTEYEILMNEAAQCYKSTPFYTKRETRAAFVKYVEARTRCYSRQAIQKDAIRALSMAWKNKPWRDFNNRIKHDESTLIERQSVSGTNVQTEEEKAVQDILQAISYASSSLSRKKHGKSRKMIR